MDQKIAQLYDEGKVEQAIHLLIKKSISIHNKLLIICSYRRI